MKTKVKTVYKGQVAVRDYIVDKAIEKGESLDIECNGAVMSLTPEKLRLGWRGDWYTSKYDGKKYRLVYFTWNAK